MNQVIVVTRKLPGHDTVIHTVLPLPEGGKNVPKAYLKQVSHDAKSNFVAKFVEFNKAQFTAIVMDLGEML